VLVLPNGQFEMTARIGVVLNRVYAQYKHHPQVAKVFGGPAARLVVAYTKNKSIASRTALKSKCHYMPAFIMLAYSCHA
jgi:hypothetical protein